MWRCGWKQQADGKAGGALSVSMQLRLRFGIPQALSPEYARSTRKCCGVSRLNQAETEIGKCYEVAAEVRVRSAAILVSQSFCRSVRRFST